MKYIRPPARHLTSVLERLGDGLTSRLLAAPSLLQPWPFAHTLCWCGSPHRRNTDAAGQLGELWVLLGGWVGSGAAAPARGGGSGMEQRPFRWWGSVPGSAAWCGGGQELQPGSMLGE